VEQAQRFHQLSDKKQQIASVPATTDKKTNNDVPFPLGGTAVLVPPYLAWPDGYGINTLWEMHASAISCL